MPVHVSLNKVIFELSSGSLCVKPVIWQKICFPDGSFSCKSKPFSYERFTWGLILNQKHYTYKQLRIGLLGELDNLSNAGKNGLKAKNSLLWKQDNTFIVIWFSGLAIIMLDVVYGVHCTCSSKAILILVLSFFQRIRSTVDEKEQKQLLMDLDVVMRSSACEYIVKFYGALFTEVIM